MDYKRRLEECCKNNTNEYYQKFEKYCEAVYDGILHWPKTKFGELAILPCPGKHSLQNATKQCMENGEWFVNTKWNTTWSNYTECWTFYDEESAVIEIKKISLPNIEIYKTWFPIIKIISHIGYSVSLFFLIASLLIFINFKKLHCPRNKLHMHLFLSFIMRGITYLLKEYLFLEGLALESDLVTVDGNVKYIKENYNWICKAVISAKTYFIVANYMLILMEGVYLSNLMFLTLTSSNIHVLMYCLLGWGFPAILITIWIFMKIHYDDTLCWTIPKIYDNILIKTPITLIVIINFILFVVILRILCGKINSMNIREKRIRYRKLMRSTLTLVLLLGIPYTISEIMSYNTNQICEIIWIFCDQTFTAFQGFIVAMMYCLLNGEVQTEIKQKYKLICNGKRPRRSRTISHTQQFTMPLQDDPFEYPKLNSVYWQKDRKNGKEITISP